MLDVEVVAQVKHLCSHEYPNLWPPQPGCGCKEWAEWFVKTYTQLFEEKKQDLLDGICACMAQDDYDQSVCKCMTRTKEGVCFDCSIGTHTFHWARRNR